MEWQDADMDPEPLQVLTVCTHNRTRSVMSMALLQAGFDRRLGPGRVVVESLGFGPEGYPAIESAIDAMRRRGLDVSAHRSRRVTAERVDTADLILASERQHVVKLAAESPTASRRSFTLPEFTGLLASDPPVHGRPLAEWATDLSEPRRPVDYLRGQVPEVVDPTGWSKRRFEKATSQVEALCDEVVDGLSPSL